MMSTLQKSAQKMSHDSKSNGFGILARKFKLMSQTSFFRVGIILLSGIFVVYWATVSGQV